MRSFLVATIAGTAALLAAVQPAPAQTFPGKIVRLVIPFPTGSSTDAQARILGPHLSERWKQQVIVDSRPGATTIIGNEIVARSPPDGHTLLFTSIQYSYLPALFAKLPYDPLMDLAPVTIVTSSPEAIVAHPSLPARNVKELIALARVRSLNMGTPGNELTTRYFNTYAKVNIQPVSYKGGAPLMVDVVGGHVELGIAGVITLQGIIRAGKVRLLGVGSTTPSLIFPDAPLIPREVPGFEIVSWWGIFAPGNTPREIVTRIRDDVAAVLQMPSVREKLLEIGGEPGGETVEQFTARVRSEIARWQKVAAAAGIRKQ